MEPTEREKKIEKKRETKKIKEKKVPRRYIRCDELCELCEDVNYVKKKYREGT